jgi:succinoglycan biosynthesis transport protein ExoP
VIESVKPSVGDDGALEQALRILRRRKWIVIQALIVVPLIALGLSLMQENQYTATASLLFRQAPEGLLSEGGTNSFIDPARESATNEELVALPVVADRAAKQIGDGVTGDQVLSSVSVDTGGDSDLAQISATTDSPELSAEMANAYGEAYIEFRRAADQAQVESAIERVEMSLSELTPEQQTSARAIALNDRIEQLQLVQALQTGKAELVQRATPPTSRSSPKPALNVAIGIVLGALLGFGLAALRDRFDRRVRAVDELEELFGLPILARVPRARSLAKGSAADAGATTPEGEAFRVLRTNLRFFNVDRELRSVLVASPSAGDGKSTIARNLATTMAEMGDKVVLVEADLHKGGSLRGLVADADTNGLSSVLAGSSLDDALLDIAVSVDGSQEARSLTVLPSGPVPPNPSELLESGRMRQLLTELQGRFDIVVVDSPALGAVGDALALIPAVDGVVVVSGLGQTTRDAVRRFKKQLSLISARPVGVVANFTEIERGYSAYYYRRPRQPARTG